jgi:exonuclease SbcD
LKILHTADIHLGRAYRGLGAKGEGLRQAQMETLERIVNLAAAEGCDAVLVAGDLYDSSQVSGGLVRQSLALFNRLDVDVLVLPGTHDPLSEASVYFRPEFKNAGNVRVFGVHGTSFEAAGFRIHGRPLDGSCGARPLEGLKSDHEAEGNIALAHASIEIPSKSSEDDSIISRQEISTSGLDYLVLGHWHTMADYSSGGVSAWYPGSPEVLKFGECEGPGSVLLVTIDSGQVKVEPRRVGRFSWVEKTIDVSLFPPDGALEAEIRSAAGEDVLARVKLTGTLPKGARVGVDELTEALEAEFFHLEIDAGGVGRRQEDLESFPEGSLGSFYVERLREEIKKANAPDRERLEEALYRGASVLAGEREVD